MKSEKRIIYVSDLNDILLKKIVEMVEEGGVIYGLSWV